MALGAIVLLLTVIARPHAVDCLSVRTSKKINSSGRTYVLVHQDVHFSDDCRGVHRTTRVHSPSLASIVLPLRIADSRADEIAMISHELRNSLGVVRNAARLLRFPVGENGIDGARVLIERHVGQMTRHIEELLDASHAGHKKALQLTHVDLRTVIEFAVNAIAPEMARHGHRLVVSLPPDALWVHADVTRLEQVFSNLLINAAKYTPDGGDIALTMERVGAHACIRFCDSGIGISACDA